MNRRQMLLAAGVFRSRSTLAQGRAGVRTASAVSADSYESFGERPMVDCANVTALASSRSVDGANGRSSCSDEA